MARLRVGFIILSLGAAWNCGGSSLTAPTVSLTGTWAGTTMDPALGTGNIQMTISQSDSALSGTWSSTFSDAGPHWNGTLDGSVGTSNFSATLLNSPAPPCQYLVTAAWNAAATQIVGTYELGSPFCRWELRGGRISLTKQ
jgi:hypothetical protein